MTLLEIANDSRLLALHLRGVLSALRAEVKAAESAEERAAIRSRIAKLTAIQSDAYAIANLCEHYYDKDYFRNPAFTLNGGKHGTF